MELEHTFTVPVGPDEAFRVLRDIQRIGPCMPGATIESVDGDEFSGKVKVKVGPIQVTYQGTAAFVDVDEAGHSATIEAKAKEARGAGTANATIKATCLGRGERETEVRVVTDLAITGKPAQFGRGVMADVGDKLLGRFADCLAEELAADQAAPGETPTGEEPTAPGTAETAETAAMATAAPASASGQAAATPEAPTPPAPTPTGVGAPSAAPTPRPALRPGDEAIDLLDVAGGAVAKRAAPVAAIALLALIVWLIRRR